MPRKRSYSEMATTEPPQEVKEQSMLQKIRSMWEFASVMQYIYIFGKAARIDEDFDIEDFETECMKPTYSEKIEEIGLTLLKWISSHRGLNYEIWDEYTRRQYQAKAPLLNPYGDDEEPKKFRNFDIFLKIRVLHQLTLWTFWNPDRIRERMEEQRETEQLVWRVEELGYDRDDRQYYVLDDNRLYRRTEPPLPPTPKAKPKATSKKAQAAKRRASKRRRVEDSETPEVPEEEEDSAILPEEMNGATQGTPSGGDVDTYGGFKWECLAITLPDYQAFIETLKKTKDPNEKILRERILDEVMPTIEAAEERQRRKIERREKELLAMEKMATAKRSSRLAGKQEREKAEQEAIEAERRRAADLAAARRDAEKQEQMDNDRQSRMMTREQRIKDREYKRILMEEEIARAAEEQKQIEEGIARGSERHLKDKIAKNKKVLEDLTNEDDWYFDCAKCGMHGKNLDDGSHSVACDKCNVWQHSKCLGISKAAAEKDDFTFVCDDCKQKEEEAKRPKIYLKFRPGSSPAPSSPAQAPISPQKSRFAGVEVPGRPPSQGIANGYHQHQQVSPQTHGGLPYPSHHNSNAQPPQQYPYVPQYGGHPQHPQNGYQQRPLSSGQQWSHNPYQNSMNHQSPAAPQPYPQHTPNWQGPPQQYPYPTYAQRPSSSHATPRPGSSHSQTNGQSAARLPSPVINRPVMSPTQGNYDVGHVAGIPQKSSPPAQYNGVTPPLQQSQFDGSSNTPRPGSSSAQIQRVSQSPSYPLSGLSPTKNQRPSPLPPPSNVPMKMSMSPPPPIAPEVGRAQRDPGSTPGSRTVSGTPIFPPSEKFAPSPQQLNKEPVPTPSKQMTPARIGDEELRRVSGEVQNAINGSTPGNKSGYT